MDRRRAERSVVGVLVRVARSDEVRLPSARTVDISTTGVLVSFDEPVGFALGQTVVASFANEPGVAPRSDHVVGHVRRAARGLDFHTYVAIEFDDGREVESLIESLLARDDCPTGGEGTGTS